MTTLQWNTPAYFNTDVLWRSVIQEFSDNLAAVGLVKETVAGEINLTTAIKPGVSTSGGVQIWRFNDSLQNTAPIFIKVDYRNSSNGTELEPYYEVGTGYSLLTLTGTAKTTNRTNYSGGGSTAASGVNYKSYCCVTEGFFGLFWKGFATAQEQNYYQSFFAVCRSCDSNGNPTATGAVVYWGSRTNVNGGDNTGGWQSLRFEAPAEAYTLRTTYTSAGFCIVPGQVTDSDDGLGNKQAYLHWMRTPSVAPVFGLCTVVLAELGRGTTFSQALVGTTARTYMSLGLAGCSEVTFRSTYTMAMLWE